MSKLFRTVATEVWAIPRAETVHHVIRRVCGRARGFQPIAEVRQQLKHKVPTFMASAVELHTQTETRHDKKKMAIR
jgi:hypothetical protein